MPSSISAQRRADPELTREIALYKKYLQQLSPEEFQALLDQEGARQRAEISAKIEREERERFFNQPAAQADFDHWSKARIGHLTKRSPCRSAKRPSGWSGRE